jgi:hypothetical protein
MKKAWIGRLLLSVIILRYEEILNAEGAKVSQRTQKTQKRRQNSGFIFTNFFIGSLGYFFVFLLRPLRILRAFCVQMHFSFITHPL